MRCFLGSLLLLGLFGAATGCGDAPAPPVAPTAAVDSQTGNLVAFWLQYADREEPVLVTDPYAALLIWSDGEKKFSLYDNTAKSVFQTTNFDAFLRRLDTLPQGIKIQRFDTCCGSCIYEMPPAERQRLTRALASGGRSWATSRANGLDHEIICTCESRGLRFP